MQNQTTKFNEQRANGKLSQGIEIVHENGIHDVHLVSDYYNDWNNLVVGVALAVAGHDCRLTVKLNEFGVDLVQNFNAHKKVIVRVSRYEVEENLPGFAWPDCDDDAAWENQTIDEYDVKVALALLYLESGDWEESFFDVRRIEATPTGN